jgi:hypothetical protein
MDDKAMANVDREKLIEWLTHSSGYQILLPKFWVEMGFPADFVAPYIRNHQGGEGKHAIQSRDGQENAAFGVSEFEIIEGIATAVGAEGGGHMFYGRGKNYQTDVARVLKALR